MDSDEVLRVLRSIDGRLALLTGPQERAVRDALAAEVLNTESRQLMFDAIDGTKGTSDLATIGKVTPRAALNFVTQLIGLRLVRSVGTGREIVVAHDQNGIVQWYLRRDVQPG